MCVLFVYVSNNPKKDGCQVIIANNRDEYYDRLTKPADFWEDAPHCISGIDLDQKRGGGTWIGAQKQGKVSALLNIMTHKSPDEGQLSRGLLIKDYLTSPISGEDYLRQISDDKHRYNKFNLITIEKRFKEWRIDYLGSEDDNSPLRINSAGGVVFFCLLTEDSVAVLDPLDMQVPEFIAFGNSSLNTPWRKVTCGENVFKKVVSEYNRADCQEQLVTSLLDLLKDKTSTLPDPQLESQAVRLNEPQKKLLSAAYVECPAIRYGTRTHTIVLVDCDENMTYLEHTMKEPIDGYNPQWDVKEHHFKISPENTSR